jgi:integrase
MPLWKDPKTGNWRYQFQHLGQRHSKTGFTTKAEARTKMELQRASLAGDPPPTPTTPSTPSLAMPCASDYEMTLETLMVKHLRLAERNLVPSTVSYRKAVFRRFIDYVGNISAIRVTTDMVENYLLTRPTNHNFNKERTELMVLFTWGHRRLMIPSNPVVLVDKLSVQIHKKQIPTPQEMAKILLAAGKDRPLLLVLFHTMGRIGEVLRLRWEDVNFQEKAIRLWTRKRQGGNLEFDWLPMNEDLEEVLWGLWQKRKSEEWVFVSPLTGSHYVNRFTLMRNICQRAGIPRYGYHTIRHFVASYLFDKKKVSLPVISKLLRHKNLQTTERYLQAIDPRFRDTMQLLKGNVLPLLNAPPSSGSENPPTHHLTHRCTRG